MALIFLIAYLRTSNSIQVVADEEIQVINLQDIVPNYQRNIPYTIEDQPAFAKIYQNRKLLEIQSINLEGISQVKPVICQQTGFFRNVYYFIYENQLFESKSSQGAEMAKFQLIAQLQGVTDCYDIEFIYNKDDYLILIDCSLQNENNDVENKFIIYSNGQQTLYSSLNLNSYTQETKRKIFYDQFYNRIHRIYLKNKDSQKNSIVEVYQYSNEYFEYLGFLDQNQIYGGYFNNQRLFILSNNIAIYETSLDQILINSKNISISECQKFDLWPEYDKLACIGYSLVTFTSISEQLIKKQISLKSSLDQEIFILKDFIVVRIDKQIFVIDIEQYQILPWSYTYDNFLYLIVERQLNKIIIFTNSSIEQYLLLKDQYLEIQNQGAKQENYLLNISSQTQLTTIKIQFANYDSHSIFYEDYSFFNKFIFLKSQMIDVTRKYYGPSLRFYIQKTSIFDELKYKEQMNISGLPQTPVTQIKMIYDDKQINNEIYYYVQQLQDNSVFYYICDIQPLNHDFSQMCGKRVQMINFKYDISTMWYQNYSFRIIDVQENTFKIIKYSQNTSSIETIFQQNFDEIKQVVNVKEKIYVLTNSGLLGYSSEANYTQLLFNFTLKDFELINIPFKDTKLVISKNPCEYFFLQSDKSLYQFYRVSTKLICTSQIAISSSNTNIQIYALQNILILFSLNQNQFINSTVFRNYDYLGTEIIGTLPLYGIKAIDYDLWTDQNYRFILRSIYQNIQTISQYDMSRNLYSSLLQKFDLDYSKKFYYFQNLLFYHKVDQNILIEIQIADQAQLITNMNSVQNQQISNLNLTIYTTLKQPETFLMITERLIVVNSQLDILSSKNKIKLKNTECLKLESKYFNGTVSQYKSLSNHYIKYQFQPYLEIKVNASIQDIQNYNNNEVFILFDNQLLTITTGNLFLKNYLIDITKDCFMTIMTIVDPLIFIVYQMQTNYQYYLNIYKIHQFFLEGYINGINIINRPTDIQQISIYVLITNKFYIQIITLLGSMGSLNFLQEKYDVFLVSQNLNTISLFQNQLIIHRFDIDKSFQFFQIIEQLRIDINQIARQFKLYIPTGFNVINMQFVNLDLSKESLNIYTIRLVLVYDQGIHDLIVDLEFEQQIQFNKLSLRQIELIDLISPFGDWKKQQIGLTSNYLYIEYFDPYSQVSQFSFFNNPNQTKQSGNAMQPFTNYWAQFKNKYRKLIEVDQILFFARNDLKSVELYKMLDGSYACPNNDNSDIKIYAYNYISSGILGFDVDIDRGAPWIWIIVSIIGFLILVGLSLVLYRYLKNRQQKPEMLI